MSKEQWIGLIDEDTLSIITSALTTEEEANKSLQDIANVLPLEDRDSLCVVRAERIRVEPPYNHMINEDFLSSLI